MSETITDNKAVYITYVVTDQHGQVLEKTDTPLGYIHGVPMGTGEILPIVHERLLGRTMGDHVEIVVDPKDGYGPMDQNLIYRDKAENVPEEFRKMGAEAQFQNEYGEVRNFVVTDISNGMVTLNGNHPWADLTLVFNIDIVEVRDASPDEIATGRPENRPPAVLH